VGRQDEVLHCHTGKVRLEFCGMTRFWGVWLPAGVFVAYLDGRIAMYVCACFVP
jgi:hypothetical protein